MFQIHDFSTQRHLQDLDKSMRVKVGQSTNTYIFFLNTPKQMYNKYLT